MNDPSLWIKFVENYPVSCRRANSGGSWEPSSQKLSWMAEIICQKSRTFVVNWNDLAKFTHFCRELTRSLSVYVCISNRMFPLCYKDVSRVFLECFRRVLGVFSVSFSHKNVIKKLTTMSKNPVFSQKVLENWLRLPERQKLFAGLPYGTMRNHTEPYGTIQEHTGPYGTIPYHKGPYCSLWYHMVPNCTNGTIWDYTVP